MATKKQSQAAKDAKAAKKKRTISKLPKKTKTALGKKGAQAAKRKPSK